MKPVDLCRELHDYCRGLQMHRFPYEVAAIPPDGVYVLFEEGELGHGGGRITRIGTHRKDGQLPGRLYEHFVKENKDRSIFRKNVGRALLNWAGDPYLEVWNLDTLPSRNREKWAARLDPARREQVEAEVTAYIQGRLSFVTLPVADKEARMRLERKLIGTVSLCKACGPSPTWLGNHSPKPKIRKSGLWQIQYLWKETLTALELEALKLGAG